MKSDHAAIRIFLLLTITTCFALPPSVKAQSIYELTLGNVKVLGSSNVHDWSMNSPSMESQGDFKFIADRLNSLTAFSFSLESKSLTSDNKTMDNRTYKTIKANEHPRIIYKLNSALITQLQKDKYLIQGVGQLTIAGATQTILMQLTVVVNGDYSLNCSGSQKLKLSDYQIESPSFLLGAMRVGNDLVIEFNLHYKKQTIVWQKS